MCTVTFVPTGNNNFILTSNRDEQKTRKTIPPQKYIEQHTTLLFPKDELAGGTWIGISDKQRLVCVLNGAFKKHIKKANHQKSRGIIAKELLKTSNIKQLIDTIDLNFVEPFTMIIVEWNTHLCLYEFIWDDTQKHFQKLANVPKIWSSATLYSNSSKKRRTQWFYDWVELGDFSQQSILKFHHSEIGNKEQAIFMKRSYVETVSITSVEKKTAIVTMHYEDVNQQKTTKVTF